jgi:hypothetical protein
MDPITTAIVAALPALATEMVSSTVKDAYTSFKSIIARKFGATSAVAKSIDDLEANPKSEGRAKVLAEHVEESKVASDTEILAAVKKLVEALKYDKTSRASSLNTHATVTGGVVGVAGAQNVSVGTLNQTSWPGEKA